MLFWTIYIITLIYIVCMIMNPPHDWPASQINLSISTPACLIGTTIFGGPQQGRHASPVSGLSRDFGTEVMGNTGSKH